VYNKEADLWKEEIEINLDRLFRIVKVRKEALL